MSVEGVKDEIFSQTCNNFACTDTCIEDQALDTLLDRLILEVRAEMPCYFGNRTHPFTPWMSPERKRICFSGGVMNPWVIDHPCPACWARKKLQESDVRIPA